MQYLQLNHVTNSKLIDLTQTKKFPDIYNQKQSVHVLPMHYVVHMIHLMVIP